MTREEALKIIKRWLLNGTAGLIKDRLGYIEEWFHKEDAEAFEMAIKALEKQKDNGWIPCSERLPEGKEKRFGNKQKRTEVLVTLRNGLVKEMTFEFATKEFWEADDENPIEHWKEDANDSGCEVIAWQPLPEPYKED